jgi:hypothetical protein
MDYNAIKEQIKGPNHNKIEEAVARRVWRMKQSGQD